MISWYLGATADGIGSASTLQALGVALAGGAFVSHSADTLRLKTLADYEDADLFAYRTPVTLWQVDSVLETVTPFFQGRSTLIPRYVGPEEESQEIIVVSAWDDLAQTVYKESWLALGIPTELSKSIFDRDEDGEYRTTGAHIIKAVEYAITQGVALQLGTVPAGRTWWPELNNGKSCGEIILACMEKHPDWMTKIDHSTVPPTFNVVSRAGALTTIDIAAVPADNLTVTRRDDLKPVRVIIDYEMSGGGEESLFDIGERAIVQDIWPAVPEEGADPLPTSGPGVISVVKDLSSVDAVKAVTTPPIVNGEKARIHCRAWPQDDTTLAAWLVKKYPHLSVVDPTHIDIVSGSYSSTLMAFSEDPPAHVNPAATVADAADKTDIPLELLSGCIKPWMPTNPKTGRIRIACQIEAGTSATDAEKAAIERPLPAVIFVATNVTSGLKSDEVTITPGVTDPGTPASQAAPFMGVARAYYEALQETAFDGSISILPADELPLTAYHGAGLNISNGRAEWATMNALVNSVEWDVDSARITLSFGPPRWWSFADFIDLQHNLRRPILGWEEAENRDTGTIPSAGGSAAPIELEDELPFNVPETVFEVPESPEFSQVIPFKLHTKKVGATLYWWVATTASSIQNGTNGAALAIGNLDTDTVITATSYIYIQSEVSGGSGIVGFTAVASTTALDEVVMDASTPPEQTQINLLVGKVTISGTPAEAEATQATFTAQIVIDDFVNGQMVKVFAAARSLEGSL